MKLDYPATGRNRDALLEVLKAVLPKRGLVLEIASGSGQHAVWFAQHLKGRTWQPTDPDPKALASIEAWRTEQGSKNLLAPLALDVTANWPVTEAQAVVCINMIHISPWAATEALFRGCRRVLRKGGVLVTYGPYKMGGEHTSPSNEAFDADLRARNAAWGVRDVDDLRREAARCALDLVEERQMPANNFCLVFRRR